MTRYYYWSDEHKVVLSIDVDSALELPHSGSYYLTPDEAARAAKNEIVREAMGKGLLTHEQAKNLLGLNPVMDPPPPVMPPPPPRVGPRGQRQRHFDIKPKRNT